MATSKQESPISAQTFFKSQRCPSPPPTSKKFSGRLPLGKTLRIAGEEFTVIGVADRIGAILGQDQDTFVILPISAFQKLFGTRRSLIFHIKGRPPLGPAEDEVRLILRGRRRIAPEARDDFYFATADTYLNLWKDIRSEEHTSELQSLAYIVCRLLLEKKNEI